MKKIFLFLVFFSFESWAQSYGNQGIINEVTTNANSKNFLQDIEPKFSNRLITETQFEDNYHATNRNDEYKNLSGKIRLISDAHVSKNLWISSYIVTETLNSSTTTNNGKNRYFSDMGSYLQEFTIGTHQEKYSLLAGKFNLNFGSAWRWDRGLWSYNLASNYKQTEKLGFSGTYRLGDAQKTGQYNFTFSSFTNDSKNLDNSLFNDRNTPAKSSGTPGDKRSLSSYHAALNVNFDFAENEKLVYNFSFLNLAVDKRSTPVEASKIADQKGFAAGMNYKFPWRENIDLDLLLEYATMKNVGGNSDVSDRYLTGNLITRFYKNWNILLGYSKQRHSVFQQSRTDNDLIEASFGYDFDKTKIFDRLSIQAGYKNTQVNDYVFAQKQNALGILVRYYKYF